MSSNHSRPKRISMRDIYHRVHNRFYGFSSIESLVAAMLMYDWISCSLWVIEIIIWLTGFVCTFPAFYFLATDSILHFNFRAIFITLFVRNFIGAADRIAVIISRAFFTENRDYLTNMLFHMSQVGVTYTAISCERLLSVFDPSYEHRCKSLLAKITLVIAIFAPASILIILYILNGSNLSGGLETYFVYASYGIAGVSSQIAYRISKRKLRRRHILRLQLNQKFASTENIRAMHIFIPCVTNEIICFLILMCLIIYSTNFTPYPLGEDPTKLSHVYDLLGAYKSSFPPCFVAFKYSKLRRSMQKASESHRKRSAPSGIESHFRELQSYWK